MKSSRIVSATKKGDELADLNVGSYAWLYHRLPYKANLLMIRQELQIIEQYHLPERHLISNMSVGVQRDADTGERSPSNRSEALVAQLADLRISFGT